MTYATIANLTLVNNLNDAQDMGHGRPWHVSLAVAPSPCVSFPNPMLQSNPRRVVFWMWRWIEIAVTLSLVLIALRRKEYLMTCISVRCPHCHSAQIVKRGKTGCGTQRYLCQNATYATGSFLLDSRYLGRLPEVKHQIIAMTLNASGVRDIARVLRVSTDTVLRELKKKEAALELVNTVFLCTRNPDDIVVAIERAGEAEMDEMWSFVGNKGNPRWRWHAIDHRIGAVLAHVFGRRKDAVFL